MMEIDENEVPSLKKIQDILDEIKYLKENTLDGMGKRYDNNLYCVEAKIETNEEMYAFHVAEEEKDEDFYPLSWEIKGLFEVLEQYEMIYKHWEEYESITLSLRDEKLQERIKEALLDGPACPWFTDGVKMAIEHLKKVYEEAPFTWEKTKETKEGVK